MINSSSITWPLNKKAFLWGSLSMVNGHYLNVIWLLFPSGQKCVWKPHACNVSYTGWLILWGSLCKCPDNAEKIVFWCNCRTWQGTTVVHEKPVPSKRKPSDKSGVPSQVSIYGYSAHPIFNKSSHLPLNPVVGIKLNWYFGKDAARFGLNIFSRRQLSYVSPNSFVKWSTVCGDRRRLIWGKTAAPLSSPDDDS